MSGLELAANWSVVLAVGVEQVAERFRERVRWHAPELFRSADHGLVFASLGRLVAGVDDPAGRAAAQAVLGRWVRSCRLVPGDLWVLGEALLHVVSDVDRRSWSEQVAELWDRAYQDVVFGLLRAARRSGDGPAWWAADLVGHDRPAEGIAVLTVRPDRPLLFRPGQAVPVSVPDCPGVWRWYCPANAPRPDGTIDLHVRAVDGGMASRQLVERSAVGDRLWLGPATGGSLVPGRTGRRDLLLIAGGTGLAPLRAIVEQIIEAGSDGRQVTLVVGARTIDELYDAVSLDKWQEAYDWLTVLPALSGASVLAHPVERGTAIRVALRHDWPEHDVYVCGPTPMIHDALPRLVVAGVPLARIHLPELYEESGLVGEGCGGDVPE